MERTFSIIEWFYLRTGVGMSLLRVVDSFMPPLR